VDEAFAAFFVNEDEIDTTRAIFILLLSPSLNADFAGLGDQYQEASLSVSASPFFCIITTFGEDKRALAQADDDETGDKLDDKNEQISFSANWLLLILFSSFDEFADRVKTYASVCPEEFFNSSRTQFDNEEVEIESSMTTPPTSSTGVIAAPSDVSMRQTPL
jgi:hypothetical protein